MALRKEKSPNLVKGGERGQRKNSTIPEYTDLFQRANKQITEPLGLGSKSYAKTLTISAF